MCIWADVDRQPLKGDVCELHTLQYASYPPEISSWFINAAAYTICLHEHLVLV